MKNMFIVIVGLIGLNLLVFANEFTEDTGPLGVKYSNIEEMGKYIPTKKFGSDNVIYFRDKAKKTYAYYQTFSFKKEYIFSNLKENSSEIFFGKETDYYKVRKEEINISLSKMGEGSLGVLQSNTNALASSGGSNLLQGAGIGIIAGVFVQGLLIAKDAYENDTKDRYYKVSRFVDKNGKSFKITSLFVYTGTYDFSEKEIRGFIDQKEKELI